MGNILRDLYLRRISGFERRHNMTGEEMALQNKATSERRYFESKMTPDDVKRLQELENLYTKAG